MSLSIVLVLWKLLFYKNRIMICAFSTRLIQIVKTVSLFKDTINFNVTLSKKGFTKDFIYFGHVLSVRA